MNTWVRPRPERSGYRRDAYLALALAIGAAVTAALYGRLGFFPEPAPLWLTVGVIVGLAAALSVRRRFPTLVAIAVAALFFVAGQFHVPEALFINIFLFIAIYTLGAWGQNRRVANVVRGIIVASMFVWIFTNIAVSTVDPEFMPEFSRSGLFSQLAAFAVIQVITNLLYFFGAWLFGNAAWESSRRRAALEAQGAELLAEREFSAHQAVALDRVRIARELHDVVAHHVSVMGVQAGAARRVLSSDPARASTSLESIEQSAREAVDELHRLVVTLRDSESDSAASSASTRGLAQIDELVREAGIAASYQVIGEERPVTPLVGFTLYRVTQEALTNVRKHAGEHATADVRLRFEPHAVELEVTDTGSSRREGRGGHGHLGMRERLAAVGGTLEVGRRERGGYLVRASIPIGAS